ncbi:MAG TPA: superoxide dismutase family protein [Planctomycetota bacterium]|nr:superoxide dismutase family protein [Planctomycetota bacterium]
MRRAFATSLCVLLFAAVLLAVRMQPLPASAAAAPPEAPSSAIAVLASTTGSKAHGVVRFMESGGKVKVVAEIEGLTPGQKHAFHVHEFGDVSTPDGMGTGGHYNPEGHDHGLPTQAKRHAGDLGNIEADASGKAKYEITVDNISISGHNAILGRGVIVHAKVDDGGQPTGNAGGRIAQGVIGVAKAAAAAAK